MQFLVLSELLDSRDELETASLVDAVNKTNVNTSIQSKNPFVLKIRNSSPQQDLVHYGEVLCCAVLCCVVLCCVVLCCAVLRCAVLCCAMLCCAVLRCAALCCAVLCCAMLRCAVLCCAALCCAVLRYPVLCCYFVDFESKVQDITV